MKRIAWLIIALVAGLSAIPSARAEDPAKTDTEEITDLKQVVAAVPHEVLVGLLSNAGKQVAASKSSDFLRQKIEGRTATLKLKIERVEKDPRPNQAQDGYRLKADETPVREGGASFKSILWVHFQADESEKIAKMKTGEEIKVTGTITQAFIRAQRFLVLDVEISGATGHAVDSH